ncbi:hypothetical protein HMPREF1557_00091 [Streptococcus sobrinus W1703]|uniref:Uncharacterized protein n=1 Tax=Streptococcus sobrinus W1703 TaxID=1227275 RepID=U2KPC7_9STRE|nr:hypothetical protein HMPREF1557_00091 [Streptococcus sobrinus W1703]
MHQLNPRADDSTPGTFQLSTELDKHFKIIIKHGIMAKWPLLSPVFHEFEKTGTH